MADGRRRGGASAAQLAQLRGELGERLARIETSLADHTQADASNFEKMDGTLDRVEKTLGQLVTDREVAKAVAKVEATAAARWPAAKMSAIVAGGILGAAKALAFFFGEG